MDNYDSARPTPIHRAPIVPATQPCVPLVLIVTVNGLLHVADHKIKQIAEQPCLRVAGSRELEQPR